MKKNILGAILLSIYSFQAFANFGGRRFQNNLVFLNQLQMTISTTESGETFSCPGIQLSPTQSAFPFDCTSLLPLDRKFDLLLSDIENKNYSISNIQLLVSQQELKLIEAGKFVEAQNRSWSIKNYLLSYFSTPEAPLLIEWALVSHSPRIIPEAVASQMKLLQHPISENSISISGLKTTDLIVAPDRMEELVQQKKVFTYVTLKNKNLPERKDKTPEEQALMKTIRIDRFNTSSVASYCPKLGADLLVRSVSDDSKRKTIQVIGITRTQLKTKAKLEFTAVDLPASCTTEIPVIYFSENLFKAVKQ